ncbi:MAG: ChaN family lipoprotein [Chitinophagaceae bacterium]|nr:ChaN family lipoprotein [Chitinophagaceae bacterium]
MKRILLFLIALITLNPVNAQRLKAYQIYNKAEDSVSFEDMVNALSHYDVVLFGELHNNSIIHWLELSTEKALYRIKGDKLIAGAEMFERDNQNALDRYLEDSTDAGELNKEARLWPNFETDYKPLVDFAKENHLRFIATNIPRRYASYVAKNGLDTLADLPDNEKTYMADMPIDIDMATPGYKEMIDMIKEHAGDKAMNFVAAQAVKDATMAASITDNWKRKHLFLHFNGDYHSKEYGGIYWYLKKEKKRLKVAVISIAESDQLQLPLPENFIPTDFNIVVPADMTKTY